MKVSSGIFAFFKAMIAMAAFGVYLICALSATAAPVDGNTSIRPIDPESIAEKFKPGKFQTETVEIGADGKSRQETEVMCMNAVSSNILVNGVLWGVAGCEPLSTSEDSSSISLAANCPATKEMGVNFYQGTMRWSADGKEIEWEVKRTAMEQGKTTAKVLKLVRARLHYQTRNCQ